jgi:hypothetical protein
MWRLAVLALISRGCSKLLGIADPVASGDGGLNASRGAFGLGCPVRGSTSFRDLDGDGRPELLRIVNGMLEVRIR